MDLQLAIDQRLPQISGLHLAADRTRSCFDDLPSVEQFGLEDSLAKRKDEFATGRLLARRLIADLGLQPEPILRGANREPLWQEGLAGSITHAGDWVVAGLAQTQSVQSVGLDLELYDRITPRLYGKVFTTREQALISSDDSLLAGAVFSAKEAGYKATFPIGGKFIGFQEAEVVLHRSQQTFSFRYLGNHEPNRVMEKAQGWFLYCGSYVLSLVIIPDSR